MLTRSLIVWLELWNFKQHIERQGIRPILARVKHPQTNGKLERWFGEYQKHRLAFSSFEEFKEWYNNRPHGSLEFEHLETPERAFRRKMRQEMYFAIGHRLFGLWEEIWIIHTKWILSRCEILSGLYTKPSHSKGLNIPAITNSRLVISCRQCSNSKRKGC